MGQSLAKNFVHIVFSTKHRQELILPPYDQKLYKYLGETCNELGCQSIKIGGYKDHVHILCLLSKKMALMNVVQKIKAHSSAWMKTLAPELAYFYWQDGYGGFSISQSHVPALITYIENQHEHHAHQGFQDEFRIILKKNQVDYDERYVWD